MEEDWNLCFYTPYGERVYYEKRWYCNETKTIHGNEKEFLNCKYCNDKV